MNHANPPQDAAEPPLIPANLRQTERPSQRRTHSAKKADHTPTQTSTSLNFYKKRNDGKYWFELIPEDKFNANSGAWKRMISNSCVDYHSIIDNPENNAEFLNYVAAATILLVNKEIEQ